MILGRSIDDFFTGFLVGLYYSDEFSKHSQKNELGACTTIDRNMLLLYIKNIIYNCKILEVLYMRYLVSILSIFCIFTSSCMQMYESLKKGWESAYKTTEVSKYSDEELVYHFQKLRISRTIPVPLHITEALTEIVKIPVGKDLISDIIARIEPQLIFVNSLETILEEIRTNKDNFFTNQKAAKLCFGLIASLQPDSVNTQDTVVAFLKDVGNIFIDKFENSPSVISRNEYMGNVFTVDYSKLANTIYSQFKSAFDIIKKHLTDILFQFGDTIDGYSSATRTISVNNSVLKLSKVTGPKLCTSGIYVGAIASDRDVTIDERLFHEILHYDHITLRKEPIDGNIFSMSKPLIADGFNPSYTGILSSLWTNAEEFRTITGLFFRSGHILYAKQCEYRYQSEKNSGLRYGHSCCYCPKVPAYFLNLLNEKCGITVHLEDMREREYIKQHDDL